MAQVSGVIRIVDKVLSEKHPEVPDGIVCEKIDKANESFFGNLMEVFSAEVGWSIMKAIYPSSPVGIRGEVDCGCSIDGGKEQRKARARTVLHGIGANLVTRDDSDFVSFTTFCRDLGCVKEIDSLEYRDLAFWADGEEASVQTPREPLTNLVAKGPGADLVPLSWGGNFSAHGLFLTKETDVSNLAEDLLRSNLLVVAEPLVITEETVSGRFKSIWELIVGA